MCLKWYFSPPQMHMYSLGMTLFWGADYEIPHSQVKYYHPFFEMAHCCNVGLNIPQIF